VERKAIPSLGRYWNQYFPCNFGDAYGLLVVGSLGYIYNQYAIIYKQNLWHVKNVNNFSVRVRPSELHISIGLVQRLSIIGCSVT
jgi:hypothetical protein